MLADHMQENWANVGRLILSHAVVEQDMFVILLKLNGLPFEEGIEIFSNETRIDKCKQMIKKICSIKGIEIDRQDEIFAQITVITKIRNALSHYKCGSSKESISINTGLTYGKDGVTYIFHTKHFDEINKDLLTISQWIFAYLMSSAGVAPDRATRAAANSPFTYKPTEPFKPNTRS